MKEKCPVCGEPIKYVECIEDGIGWWVDGHVCTKCDWERREPIHVN